MKEELKTLKDLKQDKYGLVVSQKEIKAEAIKWVKDFEGRMYDNELHYSSEFIKHFFNLTEEDLKEQRE